MQTIMGRRSLLRLGGAAALSSFALPALADVAPRRATLLNLHTGDRFDDVYFENGAYLKDALAEAMKVLRDWRTGDVGPMDPKLFDALAAVSGKLETRQPFQIISGYRSPKTNAMLAARSSGVASNSQHTLGKAVDVRVPGVALANVHKAALSVSAGGVGLYPKSNFVHVDTGRVRRWTGV
ncbi:YcbK family protein [Phenylobacterium sp.]|jgi:uncharacterized protein YcbK (DUF882 family)|uniref:YcbK family protein n=1 Tax=Phenylobacterium sp. TaxID=1871053 RepID=UPI003784265A